MAYRITSGCVQCNVCIPGCESNAINQGADQNTIDPALCVNCGVCAANCPFEAIVFEEESVAVGSQD